MNETPQTLLEAIKFFGEGDNAFVFFSQLRWPDGVVKCPRCHSPKVIAIPTRKTWECKCCVTQKQFSIKTGTIFEDSLIKLEKWLAGVWLIVNAKNGVSSYEIHRALGVTQKTAWFMLQRIRLAMQTGTFLKFAGQVEVDETFIGGKARFMHKERNEERGKGQTGGAGKSVVLGFLERSSKDRHSQVRTIHVPNQRRTNLHPKVRENVEPGSEVFTDALKSYNELNPEFQHQFIDHAERYVDGQIHTNGMENFWSLLKRSIKGTYVSVEPFHLFRYLDEQVFRFNKRGLNDGERFLKVMEGVSGKRLTYKALTGKIGERPGQIKKSWRGIPRLKPETVDKVLGQMALPDSQLIETNEPGSIAP